MFVTGVVTAINIKMILLFIKNKSLCYYKKVIFGACATTRKIKINHMAITEKSK
jgi:hypothetical protein